MTLDRLIVSNMATGYETDRLPFIINNDAFPDLTNAYVWRGRVLRKRGTSLMGRLERELTDQALGSTDGSGNFSGNIFTILSIPTSPQPTLALGSISITVGATTFIEHAPPNGTLIGTPSGSGTINYATGALTLTGAPIITAITIDFGYFPNLPVLGFEDFDIGLINQPIPVAFDTTYSYEFNQGTNEFYDVTFYKTSGLPFTWQGADYQQFYSTNYLGVNTIADSADKTGCLWVTNGNPGFHFLPIATVSVGNPTTITTTNPHGLITGDWVFFNENSGADAPTIFNGFSFQVTFVNGTTFTVPLNSTGKTLANNGIFETLTNSVKTSTSDGIRWYDGDPNVSTNFGWVNFAPPLNQYNASTNPNPFYLVGADVITPFKNRLIFSGVYLSTTAASPGIQYFPNRIVYSQAGTPFYTNPLPFAINTQMPDPAAWFQNQAAKGGFLTAPIDQNIITVVPNQDVLIYGMESQQLKLIFTFDDSFPFYFQTINAEFGTLNKFSGIILDKGVLSIGPYGIIMTSQENAQRIDVQIPDQVFDIAIANNKLFRVTSIRDFQKEFVYFTYCPGDNPNSRFNNRTLLYNYRENNWAIFEENYTHYGTFRRTTDRTWANIGTFYPTWSAWDVPWSFGADEAFFPQIVGGNQQGFVMTKGQGTAEGTSQYISAINISDNEFSSPNHCLNPGDFVKFQGIIGVLDGGNTLNGVVYEIQVIDANTFTITANLSGTYLGGGVYSRLSVPFIQTKQFPIGWPGGRQTRIGLQRFLLDNTPTGQITVNIYSSQNPNIPDNDPARDSYIIYSDIVLTSPEPAILYNPQYIAGQDQIWHRLSNSFNGDTVQLGFTLNTSQMLDNSINEQEIVIHAIALDLHPGPMLAF